MHSLQNQYEAFLTECQLDQPLTHHHRARQTMSLSATFTLFLLSLTPGKVTPPLPWTACSNHSFWEEFFHNIQPELPLLQLKAITSHPITS